MRGRERATHLPEPLMLLPATYCSGHAMCSLVPVLRGLNDQNINWVRAGEGAHDTYTTGTLRQIYEPEGACVTEWDSLHLATYHAKEHLPLT